MQIRASSSSSFTTTTSVTTAVEKGVISGSSGISTHQEATFQSPSTSHSVIKVQHPIKVSTTSSATASGQKDDPMEKLFDDGIKSLLHQSEADKEIERKQRNLISSFLAGEGPKYSSDEDEEEEEKKEEEEMEEEKLTKNEPMETTKMETVMIGIPGGISGIGNQTTLEMSKVVTTTTTSLSEKSTATTTTTVDEGHALTTSAVSVSDEILLAAAPQLTAISQKVAATAATVAAAPLTISPRTSVTSMSGDEKQDYSRYAISSGVSFVNLLIVAVAIL